jgi:cell wall-associated NlpC family hydrolase
LLRKLFPCVLSACFVVCFSAAVSAQTTEINSRQTSTTLDSAGSKRLENEVAVPASVPTSVEERRPRVNGADSIKGPFDQLLLSAIQEHLGSNYHYGGTGPGTFDCSGFVWRTFQEAGLNFTRGPASSYWATMPPATKEERSKFGTLVFFSGLAHVGIVADEHGFYHASRHHGVIYSPFNDYWLSRIDGFRRVPLTEPKTTSPNEKISTSKGLQRGATPMAGNGIENH